MKLYRFIDMLHELILLRNNIKISLSQEFYKSDKYNLFQMHRIILIVIIFLQTRYLYIEYRSI